ncbi:hypothetical protein ACJRO7_007175 [Eucalyptus globulus]|uniref:Uncharacterized protein n=1 Tax=Eucalyptus globulus TaxID=34317 RepID=A0ABD3IKA5_EUCGL
MACLVMCQRYVSPKDMHYVSCDDQESIQNGDGYLKFTRLCFFMINICCVATAHILSLTAIWIVMSRYELRIENVIQTIALCVERMMMRNSHRKKIPFVATCEVTLARYGQSWQREARTGSAVFSDFSGH